MENHPRRRVRIDGIDGIIVASGTPEARASETAGGRCLVQVRRRSHCRSSNGGRQWTGQKREEEKGRKGEKVRERRGGGAGSAGESERDIGRQSR